MKSVPARLARAALLLAILACNQPGLQPVPQSAATQPAAEIAVVPDRAGLIEIRGPSPYGIQ